MTLEKRILDSGKQLFKAKGFIKSTTKEIARNAGTSESGIFRYFDNKYDLLMAIYDNGWKELNEFIEKNNIDNNHNPQEKLLNLFVCLLNFYEQNPEDASFILINIGNTDSLLLGNSNQASISEENLNYINLIDKLCIECSRKKLLAEKITTLSLREGFLGISEGVLLGWYLYDNSVETFNEKLSKHDALELMKKVLY